MTPDEVCKRDYSSQQYNYAYKCSAGAKGACCDVDLSTTFSYSSVGNCERQPNNPNPANSKGNIECTPTGAILYETNILPDEVCKRDYNSQELFYAYSCTAGAKGACCSVDSPTSFSYSSLGTCARGGSSTNRMGSIREKLMFLAVPVLLSVSLSFI